MRRFSFLTRKERLGLSLLAFLTVGVYVAGLLTRHTPSLPPPTDSVATTVVQTVPTGERIARHDTLPASRPARRRQTPSLFLPRTEQPKPRYPRQEKYAEGTRIPLNACDTNELKKIPGVGSYIARRIVTYRQRLGGFRHPLQLREIGLNDTLLAPWFTIDTTCLQRLPVNRCDARQLAAHPYLNWTQAKALVEYRRRHGRLTRVESLRLLDAFTADDLARIAPYLSFE